MKSFLPIKPDSHFSLHNLPWGVFRRPGVERPRVGVAIGEHILDLTVLSRYNLLPTVHLPRQFFVGQETLNGFLNAGPSAWREMRMILRHLLDEDTAMLRDNSRVRDLALVHQKAAEMVLPIQIPNYTDFYSSREHATNVGSLLRGPDQALPPNWLHLPIAYHGRASSVVVSGTDIARPWGQIKSDSEPHPIFSASRRLDFELELGCVIGVGNDLAKPISAWEASKHIFGFVLVNDWSARDHQKWEYQPLGPFLSKNFATSISPWIVPLDALEPFRVAGPTQDPVPMPYLRSKGPWNFDLNLEVSVQGQNMAKPHRLVSTNAKLLYWNICQQIAHHTINGCNLQTGDLLASGTISGSEPNTQGCLLELTKGGSQPLTLPGTEQRSFLEDGDRVAMTGWAQGQGYRVGFGEVAGKIISSSDPTSNRG